VVELRPLFELAHRRCSFFAFARRAIKLPSFAVRSEPGGQAVTAYRVLPFVAMLVAVPLAAGAQVGGMPGVPGGLPDTAGSSGPLAALSPACRELLALREEAQRHERAIQRATERRAPVYEACRLLREGVAAQTNFLKGLEKHGGPCGTPVDELKLVKERHAWALWIGVQCGRSGDMWTPGENFYKR
jgi:hypothetical protein